MRTMTIQVRKKGTITLPREIRERYGLAEGDVFTLVDLGDGAFLLSPFVSKVAQLGDQAASALANADVSLDEILTALDEERETYYRDHHVRS
ncbi:MAG TPA: AbrB/MazE/SpoVT family DNA-binding domain-containing protein [Chloroflexota bacterium]|nr:AbrB/MazE/SpoVT family DNA-binding domain-containing protein [Chloroflexota bacterium]